MLLRNYLCIEGETRTMQRYLGKFCQLRTLSGFEILFDDNFKSGQTSKKLTRKTGRKFLARVKIHKK